VLPRIDAFITVILVNVAYPTSVASISALLSFPPNMIFVIEMFEFVTYPTAPPVAIELLYAVRLALDVLRYE